MALAKTFDQPTGVATSYHRVVRGIVDFVTGATTLEVASYLSADARTAGKLPIGGSSLTVPTMPDFNGDPRPWAYAQLKQRPEWADATDV
jgi:hypothetical protein